jgi:hypothetical protein
MEHTPYYLLVLFQEYLIGVKEKGGSSLILRIRKEDAIPTGATRMFLILFARLPYGEG